jgi:dTDP-4-dehydrorhamnose reductase
MNDRPILLFGATGQIGFELDQLLAPRFTVLTPHHTEVDFAKAKDLRTYLRVARPSIIINAAAYTDVDGAEDIAAVAMAINGDAPRIMAEEAVHQGIALIHYSTDYVFDGAGGSGEPLSPTGLRPYRESDPMGPLCVYGQSKRAGEDAIRVVAPPHLVLRTSWVYSKRRKNFMNTITRLAGEQSTLRVIDDQIGSPTWAGAIAEATVKIIDKTNVTAIPAMLVKFGGTYNLSAAGETSWCGFARAIVEHEWARVVAEDEERTPAPEVVPITTAEYPTPAARPAYSVLDNSAVAEAFGVTMVGWRDQLDRCLR